MSYRSVLLYSSSRLMTSSLSTRPRSISTTSNCKFLYVKMSPAFGIRPIRNIASPPKVVKSSDFRSSYDKIPISSIKSSMFIEASTNIEPSCLVTISSSSVSSSSRMSPKILSVRSCSVIIPSVLPYSLTTTPNLFLFFLNSSKILFAYKLSGINRAGRAIWKTIWCAAGPTSA